MPQLAEAGGTVDAISRFSERAKRAADALDCDLVYALVPRQSLETTLQSAAAARARRDLASVNQSMRLEDQALSAEEMEHRLADYAAELVRTSDVWTTT